MKIGILQFASNSFPPFFYEWIKTLALQKEHSFLFIGGKKYNFKNSSFVKLPFHLSHWLSKTQKFESFFLEQQLDICFVPENFKTDIEGCLLVFVTSQGLIFKNREKLKKIKQKKHIIITPFSFLKSDQEEENVFTVYPKLPILKEENSNTNNSLLKTLSISQNYLVCYSKNPKFDDVIFLLKAFSILKKQQKTQMQLVLLWEKIYPSMADKLSEYKYKHDVVLIEDKNVFSLFTKIIPNAYAFVFPFVEEKNLVAEQFFSLSQQTPIVAIENPYSKEIIGNAGILVSRQNIGELADALKKIYLDEKFKKQLSKEAQKQYEQLSFDFNIQKLNTLLEQQLNAYKEHYFKIIKQKNENSKTPITH